MIFFFESIPPNFLCNNNPNTKANEIKKYIQWIEYTVWDGELDKLENGTAHNSKYEDHDEKLFIQFFFAFPAPQEQGHGEIGGEVKEVIHPEGDTGDAFGAIDVQADQREESNGGSGYIKENFKDQPIIDH